MNEFTHVKYSSDGKVLIKCPRDFKGEFIIPNSVTKIEERAFYGRTGLTSIKIPDSITEIGFQAFSGCVGLTSIDIPNSVTKIGRRSFEGCTGLTSINIPDSVTGIPARIFERCKRLTSIKIPNSVTWIGANAFHGCTGLMSINIPNSVTEFGGGFLAGCSNLQEISIQDGSPLELDGMILWMDKTTINTYLASNTEKVFVLPKWVKYVQSHAFCDSHLQAITITSSRTKIQCFAFDGCKKLEEIHLPWKKPKILDFHQKVKEKATLYIPKGALTAYQHDRLYKDFKIIKME